ncbi:5904_t:CDS:2 [Ambispora gerdemannii]|uniref:Oxidation resistance protein 1 n=1 Tax=Ambispora gerdemannii TaxID=144530 RepID=A0A9N8WDG7_9GLOM|nr:5904_t:CDS:2 [Ambispora gerdemannii]
MLSNSNNNANNSNSSFPITPPSSSPISYPTFLVDKPPPQQLQPLPHHRRTLSTTTTQSRKTLRSNSNSNRRTRSATTFITGTSHELFWDIVGRDNYTTSLNNSPVLCNTISPPVDEDFFSLAFSKKLSSLTWRPKKSLPNTIPTMAPKANNVEPINLITTTIKSRSSSLESPIVESTLFGDWEDSSNSNSSNNSQSTPPQEVPELLASKEKMPSVQLVGRKSDTDPVLDINIAEQIRQQLPRRLRLEPTWTLLYSIDQNGTSMTTMYNNVKDKGPLVLVLKDENDQVFGAFTSESLKPQHSYYGNGECFLWKCKYEDDEKSSTPTVEFYLWSGRNEYLILSEHDYMAIGGGDGRVGLWINSDFEQGHSSPCETFENQTLSSFPAFDCLGLEIWGFKN